MVISSDLKAILAKIRDESTHHTLSMWEGKGTAEAGTPTLSLSLEPDFKEMC